MRCVIVNFSYLETIIKSTPYDNRIVSISLSPSLSLAVSVSLVYGREVLVCADMDTRAEKGRVANPRLIQSSRDHPRVSCLVRGS